MSAERVPGRAPALAVSLLGALLALALAVRGLGSGSDWSVSHPADLFKFLFLLAPAAPFLVLGGVAPAVKDRFLLAGLLVIGCLLVLSCALYVQAQAAQRERPDALHAVVYLMLPFLQASAAAVAFGGLLGWRAWRGRAA
ncbi:MAG: hypothetical protein ACKOQ9_01840 [Verrucomicrobiota bacterium]